MTVVSVSVLCVFASLGDAASSHEFRVEGGKLRYIIRAHDDGLALGNTSVSSGVYILKLGGIV